MGSRSLVVVLDYMFPQGLPGPIMRAMTFSELIAFMVIAVMHIPCSPGLEYFIAIVAGDRNSFQMVGLDVLLQSAIYRFLSTNHTTIQQVTILILAECLFHHGVAFCIKLLEIFCQVVCRCNRSACAIFVRLIC